MAVNKSNAVTHWAGAAATLHPVTPSFLWHQAARGVLVPLTNPSTTPLTAPSISASPACPTAAGVPGLSSSRRNTIFLESGEIISKHNHD